MEFSKLSDSSPDWPLTLNTNLILTKNAIIQSIVSSFNGIALEFIQTAAPYAAGQLPTVFRLTPKISKGEQLEGLPWVMLDYPRGFNQEEGHFAIRCLFWWGHFFSIQLHTSGSYNTLFTKVAQLLEKDSDWQSGFTNQPYQQNMPNQFWINLKSGSTESGLYGKIVKKHPLVLGDSMPDFFCENFKTLTETIAIAKSVS